MICNLIRFIPVIAACLIGMPVTVGDIIFDLRSTASPSGSILNNVFSLTQTALSSAGVSFDATLTVTGNKTFVATSPTGMGTGTSSGGNNISGSDTLTFSMSISNMVGGVASFSGFTLLELANLTFGENATINVDGGAGLTIGGMGAITTYAISNGSTFVISAQPGATFQSSRVSALFTGTPTAVPEPSAFLAFVIVSGSLPWLRRFRRRANSVDSDSLVA